MNQSRRHFADHEKVAILKRQLIDKAPVSDLCDKLDIYPNQDDDWLKRFFENGQLVFANCRKAKAVEDAKNEKIQRLEAKFQRKNEVTGELMEAHTQLKKILGNSNWLLGPPRYAWPAAVPLKQILFPWACVEK